MSNKLWANAINTQLRVIGALMMREIITRYGRHNVGFLWLILEPIIFTLGVVILWTLTHTAGGVKVDVVPFAVTGYSCLLVWRLCTFRGLKSIESNLSLLHHRPVKIIDIFITRMLLEIAGVTASFIVLSVTMIIMSLMDIPNDLGLYMFGWFFMCWLSATVGTILGCLSEFSDMVERLWHPIGYFLLPVSGIFFMVDWLPTTAQTFVMIFPMAHPVEMLRNGYWGDIYQFHFDIKYIFFFCILTTLISLILISHPKLKSLV